MGDAEYTPKDRTYILTNALDKRNPHPILSQRTPTLHPISSLHLHSLHSHLTTSILPLPLLNTIRMAIRRSSLEILKRALRISFHRFGAFVPVRRADFAVFILYVSKDLSEKIHFFKEIRDRSRDGIGTE